MTESSGFGHEFVLPQPDELPVDQLPAVVMSIFSKSGHNEETFRITSDLAFVYDFGSDRVFVFRFGFVHGETHELEGDSIATVDISNGGLLEGWGHFGTWYDDSYADNLPRVQWTKTEPHLIRQGLGIRRLRIMNDLSVKLFGIPLHASDLQYEEAGLVWGKLLRNGEAEWTEVEGGDSTQRFVVKHAIK